MKEFELIIFGQPRDYYPGEELRMEIKDQNKEVDLNNFHIKCRRVSTSEWANLKHATQRFGFAGKNVLLISAMLPRELASEEEAHKALQDDLEEFKRLEGVDPELIAELMMFKLCGFPMLEIRKMLAGPVGDFEIQAFVGEQPISNVRQLRMRKVTEDE